jgi:ferredoxin
MILKKDLNRSILEILEDKEIFVNNICRFGMCSSCKIKIISGKVERIFNNEPLIKLEKNEILACNYRIKSDSIEIEV